jgi:hypothetical protein
VPGDASIRHRSDWRSVPLRASAEEPRFNPPKHYYLALGDSFTYGFQGPGLRSSANDTPT